MTLTLQEVKIIAYGYCHYPNELMTTL